MSKPNVEPSNDFHCALELIFNSIPKKRHFMHLLGILSLLYFLKKLYKTDDIKLKDEISIFYNLYLQNFNSFIAQTLACDQNTDKINYILYPERVFEISLQILYTIHREVLVPKEPDYLQAFIPLIGKTEKSSSEYYIFPSPLYFSEDILFPKPANQIKTKSELTKYKKELISKFTKNVKKALEIFADQEDRIFRLLYNLTFYYLWSLPGVLPLNQLHYFSFVSLYEVIKVYISLVLSLFTPYNLKIIFSYNQNSGSDNTTGYVKNENIGEQVFKECKIVYIKGDISGIQKFLFNTTNISGSAKRLRGKSSFLTLIDKLVLYKIFDQLGYPLSQITFSGGGHFEVLLGYEEGIQEYLKSIVFNVDKELFEAFSGDLGLILESGSFSIDELIKKGYYNIVYALIFKVGEAKKRKFLNLFLQMDEEDIDEILNRDIREDKSLRVCPACARYYITEGHEETCKWCQAFYELGDHIGDAKFLYFVPQYLENSSELFLKYQITLIDFSPLGKIGLSQHSIDLKKIPPSVRVFRLNDTRLFEGNFFCADGFMALEQHLPYRLNAEVKQSLGRVRTFEELALASRGDAKIAYCKGDLDDLGEILRGGMNLLQLWLPYSMLSTNLDLFFSGYLRFFLSSTTYRDQIYTLYAGGDDFFLIGSWDKVLKFINLLVEKFNSYVGYNQKFHFSVGVINSPPNFPVRFACDMVNEGLQKAKENKPAIYVFGEVLSWNSYKKLFSELTENIVELIENDIVSRTLIYRFYNLFEQYKIYEAKGLSQRYRVYPLFFYFLNRNVESKEIKEKIIKWLLDEENNYQIREEALVKLKYVLTLTRKR